VDKDILFKRLSNTRETQLPKKPKFLWREKSRSGANPFPKRENYFFLFFPSPVMGTKRTLEMALVLAWPLTLVTRVKT